jgi:hypothetical protein
MLRTLLGAGVAASLLAVSPSDPAPLVIRVQAVRIWDDDCGRAADITPRQVTQWVEKASEVYAPAGIRFQFDPAAGDYATLASTILNSMTGEGDANWKEAKRLGNRLAARFPGKMVVLFRHGPGKGPTGAGFASTGYDFVAMPGFGYTSACGHQNRTLFAHEAGHYLGLSHTFTREYRTLREAEEAFERKGRKPEMFDGDGLSDTAPDPQVTEIQCQPMTRIALNGVPFVLPRENIMAYYDAPRKTVTPLQVARVRWVAETRTRGLGAMPVNTRARSPLEAETLKVVDRRSCRSGPQRMAAWGADRWSRGSNSGAAAGQVHR